MAAVGVRLDALVWFAAAIAAIVFFGYMVYRPLAFNAQRAASRDERIAAAEAEKVAASSVGIAQIREIGVQPTATLQPTETVQEVELVQLDQKEIREVEAFLTPTPIMGSVNEGYGTMRVVGRFSNYWPQFGGTNCFGDCEHFADGNRVDQAIAEKWKVVACPRELLPGTRIEFPIESGLIWTCRDYGDAIFLYYGETGLPIYWFDFLSDTAWVDYGSYIQVDIHVPCGQVEGLEGCG